jgi:pimeloyl-ACP methyl ester carboxylesterase
MSVTELDIEAPANIRHGDVAVSDGVRIHYQEAGEGVAVVLLHGYTSCCDASWFADGMAKELARTHRVIGIDARGHGRSEKPHDPSLYDGDRMPRDVIEVLDRLGVEKAHFHGYSMGGGIVAHLMARRPDRFITAGFGGSGVRETDETLAAQAAAADPQGVDPDQDAGRAKLAARADRDNEALKAVQDGRQAKPRVRCADLQDPEAGARGEGFPRRDPARPRPQHRDHGRFYAQALYRHRGRLHPE